MKQYITWREVDDIVTDLELEANAHVITLYRGGLPLGVMLSNRYGINLSILDYQSYDGNSKDVRLMKNAGIKDNEILYIVDDIADTGNSIEKSLEFLHKTFPNNEVRIFTIVGRKHNPPEWKYSIEYKNWCIFPWEECVS